MEGIVAVGYGLVRVGEYWAKDIVSLAADAASMALDMAKQPGVDALYVGSALSGALGIQGNLAIHVADELGFADGLAVNISAGGASSGLAVLSGIDRLLSGSAEYVLVGGVEKVSDNLPSDVLEAILIDIDRRVLKYSGLTDAGLAAIMARLYMEEYGVSKEKITSLSVLDHENGVNNPYAMFRRAVSLDMAMSAPLVADPLTIFDVAPYGDGAAFLVLTTKEKALEEGLDYMEFLGYGVARNRVPISHRSNLLSFDASAEAASVALSRANISIDSLRFVELFDNFSITGVLALEALGLSGSGSGADDVWSGKFNLDRQVSVDIMGGLKARGHPIGATGAYQLCEAFMRFEEAPRREYGLVHMMSGFDDQAIVFVVGGGGSA